MDRSEEKNESFIKLGALFNPFQRLVDEPSSYDDQERAEIIARYCAEYPKLIQEFQTFSVGQPGHNYIVEYYRFHESLFGVAPRLAKGQELADLLAQALPKAKAAISAVPIPRDCTIFEAQTPFSTYCAIKDLVEGDATSSIVWIDPYMSPDLFHRFLRNVAPAVSVTLVTCAPKATSNKREQGRWDAFLNVSRLYAAERGAGAYRLVVHNGLLHDRWLLLDDKRLYGLGGSAKDAGDRQYFTLARLEASPDNLQKIKDHVDTATEFFGRTTPEHS